MTHLCNVYVDLLAETPLANPNYRSETPQLRIKHYELHSTKLSFVARDRKRWQTEIGLDI